MAIVRVSMLFEVEALKRIVSLEHPRNSFCWLRAISDFLQFSVTAIDQFRIR